MSDHTVIITIAVVFGAWGLLVSWTFGQAQTRIEEIERHLIELEGKLKGRSVA